MTDELSGIELRLEVARALGWTELRINIRHDWVVGLPLPPHTGYDIGPVPKYEHDLNAVFVDVVPFAESKGFWVRVDGAWRPGDAVYAGFTQHGATGWNGQDDYQGSSHDADPGKAVAAAICRAFLELVRYEKP